MPWLLYIRKNAKKPVNFWQFDGRDIPADASVIAEAYPVLWSHSFPKDGRTSDQHDAYSVAAWMRQADQTGSLADCFEPELAPE